ncbi:MAG: Peptidase [Microgenomates group bacterium GW2011_GWC1_39_7b]|uniref:Peptidase n=3 Tax=Candidatus Woeseibacteriota TaxID=1752722 RepID=A0A0G0UUN3_9BACT|nr:MAG: Peptidase [Candidatus Woesebacteria bacterium GW2011_GWB1_39_10]KKR26688.1 MAG: Peptidase [Microgenomates group bacterium GW2011_GWC1_39_7b]KKR74195.1 MAG: Peptidase [Candidatus Woesebacteria bacterium GW2011_GWA2_40_7]KKR92474.1 MAG: Peptidase [Candidatus Woesebacteria bacterium GW2011_GWA1_41_13b]
MELLLIILGIAGLAYTIIIHEVAHGWVANRLGDPTARLTGRLTLNPIPHIDPLGTIIVPLLMYFSPAHFVFGWAKPVPIDPYNLKNPKKDTLLIALAGPLSNIILAVILAIIFWLIPMPQIFADLVKTMVGLNVGLAVFNLIPVSPLDGEKILVGLLPDKEAREFEYFMNKFGFILLAFLIFPIFGGVSLISPILYPIINFILNLLIPGFPRY